MMPPNLYNIQNVQKEHCVVLLYEAGKARLLQQAKLEQPSFKQPYLAVIGDWLIAWGWWLKQHYTTAQTTALGSGNTWLLPPRNFLPSEENSILRQRRV